MSPTYDGTSCASQPSAPLCDLVQTYPIDVKWLGVQKNWFVKPVGDVVLADVEDIAIEHSSVNGTSISYALLISAGVDIADPRTGLTVEPGFIRVPIPEFASMPITKETATPASCSGTLIFPEADGADHNILASAIDPATGRWYMIDDRIRGNSTLYAEPVVYYLTKDQLAVCNGELARLGTLPVAHWLLLHIVSMTDEDKKQEYLKEILDFIAEPGEDGSVSESHPNAAIRKKIEDFFGLNRSTLGNAATTESASAKTLEELYEASLGVPAILKSLMVTGLSFNYDGSKFVLSTFGGPVVGWEVGIRLDQGIPAAKVFMQEFLHSPVVADEDFAARVDEVGGVSFFLNVAPSTDAGAERLIFSTEKNPDEQYGPWAHGEPAGDGPIYVFSCADKLE